MELSVVIVLSADKGYPYSTKAVTDWRVDDYVVDGCTNVYCDPTQYDMSTLYKDPTNEALTNYILQALIIAHCTYRGLWRGETARDGWNSRGICESTS